MSRHRIQKFDLMGQKNQGWFSAQTSTMVVKELGLDSYLATCAERSIRRSESLLENCTGKYERHF